MSHVNVTAYINENLKAQLDSVASRLGVGISFLINKCAKMIVADNDHQYNLDCLIESFLRKSYEINRL